MERGSRLRWIITAVLGVALLGAGWFLLAPQLFGGSTAYVIVSGSSMQPGIGGGDLVLLRTAQDYRVGDVVGYRSPSLHTVVLHRIVEVEGGRFTFKGDANSWIDPDRPSSSDLLGRMWVRVPGLGSALRQPWVMFTLIGVLLLCAFGGLGAGGRSRRQRARPVQPALRSSGTRGSTPLVIVAGLALVASAVLGVMAFTVPDVGETTVEAPYAQSGSFAYAATVPPGAVYGRDGLVTGDPIYLRLVRGLNVSFDYAFRSTAPHATTGVGQLTLMIKDVNGWTHRSSLGPSTTFAGDVATLTGRIDLAAIRTLLGRLERTTGVLRDSYEIQVVADVRTQVTAGGETEQVSFAPGLSFRMDALEVQPMPAGTAPDAGATLHPTGRGQLETAAARPASLSVLGRNVNVRLARIGAVAGGVSSVAVLLLGIVLLHRRRGEDELTWILRRYGRMLAPVSGPMERANREIHVADMETLVWLAEHHDRLILYARTARGHDFAMEYGGVCYRYDVGSPIPAPTIGTNGHARIDSNGSSARRPAAAP